MSRCRMPARCGGREAISDANQQLDDLPPAPARTGFPIPERAAVHELGHQILTALEFAGIVNGEDMRVIERGGGLGFALEAAAAAGSATSSDRNLIATGRLQLGIERPIDDAHSAGTERRLHFVDADHAAGQRRRAQLAYGVRRDGECRDFEEVEPSWDGPGAIRFHVATARRRRRRPRETPRAHRRRATARRETDPRSAESAPGSRLIGYGGV